MARLYAYADSNDKSGYVLRDGSDEGNVPFHVAPPAERLFDKLGFEPGAVDQQRDPRLPNQSQWALYEVGRIYTGGSDPPRRRTSRLRTVQGPVPHLRRHVAGAAGPHDPLQSTDDDPTTLGPRSR